MVFSAHPEMLIYYKISRLYVFNLLFINILLLFCDALYGASQIVFLNYYRSEAVLHALCNKITDMPVSKTGS